MRDRFIGIVAFAASLACPSAAVAGIVSASEFYHPGFGYYFTTASAAEAASLDAGVPKGWSRTLTMFRVDDASGPGLVPVCRFFSASFAPQSSHFYTPFAEECAAVKRNPHWTFEGDAFFARLPDAAGDCAAGTTPIFRYYNGGQGGAPNHRYTPYPADRATLLREGWVAEGLGAAGVAFCAPASFDVALSRTQAFAGATWEFSHTTFGAQRITVRFESFGIVLPGNGAGFTAWLPYLTHSPGYGVAGWHPYAGKMLAVLGDEFESHAFIFDYDGETVVQGCYVPLFVGFERSWVGPCRPFTARRL